MSRALGLLMLVACGSSEPATASAPAAAPAPAAPAAAPAAPPTAPLPDVTQGLTADGCNNGPGGAGADVHYMGVFQLDGNTVRGEEKKLVHANTKWVDLGGADCQLRWSVTGHVGEATTCGSCDLGLELNATPDLTGSSCPEDMVKKDAKPMQMRYDVARRSDGTALFYYSKSGNLLGEGFHSGGAVNFVTAHKCDWY